MPTLVGVLVLVSAVAASYFAADRKGRSHIWMVWTFLFAPVLLVLICLPKTGNATEAKRWFALPIEIFGASSVLIVIGLIAYSVVQTGTLGGPPKCDSAFTLDTAKQAFAGAPIGKFTGLSIVELQQIQEISANATARQCRGTALLNNTTEHAALFDIKPLGDKWLVSIRLPDL